MKLRDLNIRTLIFAGVLILSSQGSFAYAPHTTHAGLTQEMIAFFEEVRGIQFTSEERELIIQASIDEDNPSVRALNHFYDPVHNRGINDYRTSYQWATDELSGNNFTWGAGIDAYAKGDRRAALITLGHVLHLIEDSAVPDHTRNDPHMGHGASGLWTGSSPFEDWADRAKTRTTLAGFGASLTKEKPWRDPSALGFICLDLRECFDYIATYSNQNFYSEDTKPGDTNDYTLPIIQKSDGKYYYGTDQLTQTEVKLLRKTLLENGKSKYELTDGSDFSVLSSYFDRLAPQAIATGARVIDLFLAQGEAARVTERERQKRAHEQAVSTQLHIHNTLADAGLWRQFTFGFSELFVRRPLAIVGTLREITARSAEKGIRAYRIAFGQAVHFGTLATESVRRGTPYAVEMVKEKYIEKSTEGQEIATTAVGYVVVGAEGSLAQLEELAHKLTVALKTFEEIRLAEASKYNGEVLGIQTVDDSKQDAPSKEHSLQEKTPSTPPTGGGIGGADNPQPVIILGVAAGSASLPELPPPPSPSEDEEDPDESGSGVPPDTTAPTPPEIVSINGMTFSGWDGRILTTARLVIMGNAEASSTVALSWKDGIADYVLFFFTKEDGEWSYNITLPEGTTTLTLTATDAAGNTSEPIAYSIVVEFPKGSVRPSNLVINELAPMGTIGDAEDEWIELYNTTDAPLSLDNMELCIGSDVFLENGEALCATSRIPLAGTLPPRGYLLIARERTDHTPVFVDPIPHIIAPFTLPDDGAAVMLRYHLSDGTAITIDALPYCAGWCGRGTPGAAIERWRSDRPTEDYSGNWGAPLPELTRGTDRTGEPVVGTPGTRNSLNYLLSLSDTIGTDLLLAQEPGGYLVNGNTIMLAAGRTLTIAPGVTVKFRPGQMSLFTHSLLRLLGPLNALGTAEEPIIFTTTDDDRAGGYMMSDGAPEDDAALEHAGGLDFLDGSEGTALMHVEFRLLRSGLHFENTTATMTSVTITDSLDGVTLSQSHVNASDLLIRNIDGGDAMRAYNGAILQLASTSIIDTGDGVDALNLFAATLIAEEVVASEIGGNIVLSEATATVNGLTLTDVRGMPDISITGGTTTLIHASLSGISTTMASGSDDGIVGFDRASLVIASSTIADYAGTGIAVRATSSADIASSTIEKNGIGLFVTNDATAEIHGSALMENAVALMNLDPDYDADASQNYWGLSDGPTPDTVVGNAFVYPFYAENPVGADPLPELIPEPMLL